MTNDKSQRVRESMADYVEVNERLVKFYEAHPEGRIQSEIVYWGPDRVIVKAMVFRSPDDTTPCIGHSWLELPGRTPYTRGSELENAETSAWGRALAALGIEVKRGIASKQEVQMRGRQEREPRPARRSEQRSAPDPQPQTGPLTNVGWFYTKCWNDLRLSKREVLALHGAKDDVELEAAMQPFESWDAFFDKTAEMHAKAVPA